MHLRRTFSPCSPLGSPLGKHGTFVIQIVFIDLRYCINS